MSTKENVNVSGNNVSKSKKKRIKRKQAKQQGSTGDDASSVSSLPSMPDSVREATATASLGPKLNPIDKLRMDLEKMGYSVSEIEAAMSEMWDSNLPYDRFEDVLAFLKRSKHSDTVASKTEALLDGTDSVTATMTSSFESMSPALQKDQEDVDFPPATADAPFLATTTSSIKAAPTPNLNLVTKLQLVANYENLHDAIYAITQWANQAKATELSIVMEQSALLSTFVRRCILECSESAYGKIFPYFFNLLCILIPPNRVFLTKTAYKDSVSKILLASRKAVLLSHDVPVETETKDIDVTIATTVSKSLLSILSAPLLADQRLSTSSMNANKKGVHTNSANDYSDKLSNLLQKRDAYKRTASHATAAATYSITATSHDNDNVSIDLIKGHSLFGKDEADLTKRFAETKEEHDSLLSKMDVAESRYKEECGVAESDLVSCREKKEAIFVKKADLLRQIQLLEEEEAALIANETIIENNLMNISAGFKAEKECIEKQLEQPKKVMKLARACRGLEDIVVSLQKSLATLDAPSKVTVNGQSGITAFNNGEKFIANFFATMLNYFQVEAECVKALKTRIASTSTNADVIGNELAECKNLGLKTNVLQLERSLAQITQCVSEDNDAVKHFLDDAIQMKNELVFVTQRLVNDNESLILPHLKLLKDIESSLCSLTIPCEDLSELIPDSTDAVDLLDKPVDSNLNETVEANKCEQSNPDKSVSPTEPKPLIEMKPAAETAAMPKFSWASKVPLKFEAKGLREIQEEEKVVKNS